MLSLLNYHQNSYVAWSYNLSKKSQGFGVLRIMGMNQLQLFFLGACYIEPLSIIYLSYKCHLYYTCIEQSTS